MSIAFSYSLSPCTPLTLSPAYQGEGTRTVGDA